MALRPNNWESTPLSDGDIYFLQHFKPSHGIFKEVYEGKFKELYEGNWDMYLWPKIGTEHPKGEDSMARNSLSGSLDKTPTPEKAIPEKKKTPTLRQQMEAALKNIEKKRAADDARKALEWDFIAPHEDTVSMNEIALTLTRKNPVAIVEQKGYLDSAAVVIHSSIVIKAKILHVEYPDVLRTLSCEHYCAFLDTSQQIGKVLKWVRKVRAAEWPLVDGESPKTKIHVRYPKC